MNGERIYRSEDGREWVVTLESLGRVLAVAPDLENTGAMLPQDAVHITFASGEEAISEEYTALARLEDLSDDDVAEWFRAARRQKGV